MSYLVNPYMVTSAGIDLTGLLVYWKMAEASSPISNSSTSDDTLGTAGNLIVTGGTFQQSGIGGSAYSLLFDGTDDTGNVASSQSLFKFMYDDAWDFTINFWFKKSSSGGSGEDVMINSRGAPTRLNGVQMKFAETSVTNAPCFVWKGECADSIWVDKETDVDSLPADTDWHMCTIKGELSNPQASAVNITIDNSTSYDLAREDTLPSGSANSDLLFYIASENNDGGFWAGYLTEWSIWNRVLTSAELTTIYNNGSSGIPV